MATPQDKSPQNAQNSTRIVAGQAATPKRPLGLKIGIVAGVLALIGGGVAVASAVSGNSAAGTGTSSASLAKSGASVVAADFSPGMIEVGRKRQAGVQNLVFVEADATKLPFDDDEFDAVTISFGLRNVNEPKKALAEFFRVTKPGGRLVICEFSTPPAPLVRTGYGIYQRYVMPPLVKLSSSNDTAYDYLNESINAWPDQRTLAAWIREVGYADVAWRNLTLGVVALHRATKPISSVE